MRLGAIPTTAREWLAARLNLAPLPAAEALLGMLHSRVLMAGTRLGLFAALETGPQRAGELAARLKLDPAAARLLCDALVAARYLTRRRDGTYAASRTARRYLFPSAPRYLGDYLEYTYDQWEWVERLESVVRGGAPADIHRALGQDDADVAGHGPDATGSRAWSRYLLGLAELARVAAGEVAAKVPLAPPHADGTPRCLLDIGGGHGQFSVALCRRHADLTATIFDLPGAVAAAEPIARRLAGPRLAPRLVFRAGDALSDPLSDPLGPDGAYDGALIFQVIHHLPPAAVPDLIRRAVASVRPGGWVTLLDLLEPEAGHPRDALAAYTALYFHLTSRGQSYTPEHLRGWLRDAGCGAVRTIPLLRVPGQPLIAGRRAG